MKTPEELGLKMNELGLWTEFGRFTWAARLKGYAIPYFCTVMGGDAKPVAVRFLMLEGWQTLHDFARTAHDHNFGFYSNPMEMPHFELVVMKRSGGEAPPPQVKLFRHDPGYFPRELNDRERELCGRILWEAYGLMLRYEGDPSFPLTYAEEGAMFARVEGADGAWHDEPLAILPPPAYVERVSFEKADLKRAKDLPFVSDEVLDVDFRLLPTVMTCEKRPRCCYLLAAVDGKTGARVIWHRMSINADCTLKALWERMAPRLLKHLIARGHMPGEIRTVSGRVFRMLRPMGMEIPFKFSLHDKLPLLEKAVADEAKPGPASAEH